jgi:thiamine phosphate synthase YjbQ (UPF0047 family)
MISQHSLTLSPRRRGFHLVTREILDQLPELPEAGLLHVFIEQIGRAHV